MFLKEKENPQEENNQFLSYTAGLTFLNIWKTWGKQRRSRLLNFNVGMLLPSIMAEGLRISVLHKNIFLSIV